jgi:hypothetical protein
MMPNILPVSNSYGMCKFKSIFRYFAQNGITPNITLDDIISMEKDKVPNKIVIRYNFGLKEHIFQLNNKMQQGAYGRIYDYMDINKNELQIILKTGNVIDDIYIYKEIGYNECKNALVGGYPIGNQYFLMDRMEGTIDGYVRMMDTGFTMDGINICWLCW